MVGVALMGDVGYEVAVGEELGNELDEARGQLGEVAVAIGGVEEPVLVVEGSDLGSGNGELVGIGRHAIGVVDGESRRRRCPVEVVEDAAQCLVGESATAAVEVVERLVGNDVEASYGGIAAAVDGVELEVRRDVERRQQVVAAVEGGE